jgi:phosphomannomutase
VREQGADLAFVIDEDGQTCAVWDERGQWTPPEQWRRWLERTPAAAEGHALDHDGVVTLGALLQALSFSDAPLSERLAEA